MEDSIEHLVESSLSRLDRLKDSVLCYSESILSGRTDRQYIDGFLSTYAECGRSGYFYYTRNLKDPEINDTDFTSMTEIYEKRMADVQIVDIIRSRGKDEDIIDTAETANGTILELSYTLKDKVVSACEALAGNDSVAARTGIYNACAAYKKVWDTLEAFNSEFCRETGRERDSEVTSCLGFHESFLRNAQGYTKITDTYLRSGLDENLLSDTAQRIGRLIEAMNRLSDTSMFRGSIRKSYSNLSGWVKRFNSLHEEMRALVKDKKQRKILQGYDSRLAQDGEKISSILERLKRISSRTQKAGIAIGQLTQSDLEFLANTEVPDISACTPEKMTKDLPKRVRKKVCKNIYLSAKSRHLQQMYAVAVKGLGNARNAAVRHLDREVSLELKRIRKRASDAGVSDIKELYSARSAVERLKQRYSTLAVPPKAIAIAAGEIQSSIFRLEKEVKDTTERKLEQRRLDSEREVAMANLAKYDDVEKRVSEEISTKMSGLRAETLAGLASVEKRLSDLEKDMVYDRKLTQRVIESQAALDLRVGSLDAHLQDVLDEQVREEERNDAKTRNYDIRQGDVRHRPVRERSSGHPRVLVSKKPPAAKLPSNVAVLRPQKRIDARRAAEACSNGDLSELMIRWKEILEGKQVSDICNRFNVFSESLAGCSNVSEEERNYLQHVKRYLMEDSRISTLCAERAQLPAAINRSIKLIDSVCRAA
ncbi:hypothetical protein KY362_07990 [Candidatus Woesearchaeota archaeon]|nr:hypothetical protein [Candidatus Woesearchaeota archaeon]